MINSSLEELTSQSVSLLKRGGKPLSFPQMRVVDGEAIVVEDRHIDETLEELVFESELTKRLLGASDAF